MSYGKGRYSDSEHRPRKPEYAQGMSKTDTRESANVAHTTFKELLHQIEKGKGDVDIDSFNITSHALIGASEAAFVNLARATHACMPNENFIMRLIQEGHEEIAYMTLFLFDGFDSYWNTPALQARGVRLASELRLSPPAQAFFRIELRPLVRQPREPRQRDVAPREGESSSRGRPRSKRSGQNRSKRGGEVVASIALGADATDLDEVSIEVDGDVDKKDGVAAHIAWADMVNGAAS